MVKRYYSSKERREHKENAVVKHRIFCPYAGKMKLLFEEPKQALNYLRWNSKEILRTHGYCPTRYYYCSGCGGYHVTSGERHQKEEMDAPIE